MGPDSALGSAYLTGPQVEWYCLRSQPKHEHIAAAHLQAVAGVEAFLPRVRFQRSTRVGKVWVTEAVFPNYLFARFDWQQQLRQVQAARGVSGVVHFGDRWPVIPAATIEELRQIIGDSEFCTVSDELAPGDNVHIVAGAMHGLSAVVRRVMPARERVAVLMDFLGRPTEIEVPAASVIKEGNSRESVFGAKPSAIGRSGAPAKIEKNRAD